MKMRMKWVSGVVLCGAVAAQAGWAQAGTTAAGTSAAAQAAGRAPAQLPGNGLAQHDFVYSGESHDRKIFIVPVSYTHLDVYKRQDQY